MSRQQPGWGAPSQPFPPVPQPQPRRSSTGKNLGIGCLGIFALIILIAVTSAVVSDGGSGDGKGDRRAAAAPTVGQTDDAEQADGTKAKDEPRAEKEATRKAAKPEAKKEQPPKVVFKVWGTASAGVDTTYGSDTENIQGSGLPMTKSLKLKDDAMYYVVTAQLQGGGDIHCSVTVDGKTKKAHAKGGYNICSAQLSGGLLGGWR